MITIARIDERLIHGQVAYAWTVSYPSQALMVIDDEVVNDSLRKMTLEMATPSGMKCFIVNQQQGVELLKKYQKQKIFVVVANPNVLVHLVENGIELPEVNVGGLYFKEGRQQVSNTVYLDDDLRQSFKQLKDLGVKLSIRATPSDKEIDLGKHI